MTLTPLGKAPTQAFPPCINAPTHAAAESNDSRAAAMAPTRRVLADHSPIGSTRITTYDGHLARRVSAADRNSLPNGLWIGACAQRFKFVVHAIGSGGLTPVAMENSDRAPHLFPVATAGVPGAVVLAWRTAANRRWWVAVVVRSPAARRHPNAHLRSGIDRRKAFPRHGRAMGSKGGEVGRRRSELDHME
jgi:hypothetical protein